MDLLISTVNATGGVRASISRRVDGMLVIGHCSPVGDPDWMDIGDAYLLACMSSSVDPLINGERLPVGCVAPESTWRPGPYSPSTPAAVLSGFAESVKKLRTSILCDDPLDDVYKDLDHNPRLKVSMHYFMLALSSLEQAQHFLGLAAASADGMKS